MELGAYKAGTNSDLDQAIQMRPKLLDFLKQQIHESTLPEQAMALLKQLSTVH